MAKTEKNLAHYLDDQNDRDYLEDLFLNLQDLFSRQSAVTFQIIKAKEKGFSIKVGGLFGFVSYGHLSWSYPSMEYWHNVSKYLEGRYFTGRIHQLKNNPIRIKIDAKEQLFDKPLFHKDELYKAIVVKKSKYGFFLELGFHFDWKCGSILTLLHNSLLSNSHDGEAIHEGDVIHPFYVGLNDKGRYIFGMDRQAVLWINGSLDHLVNTIQPVHISIDDLGKKQFMVHGKYHARIPMLKSIYQEGKQEARIKLSQLQHDDVISCEILRINKSKDAFILRLLSESIQR